ncbi:MAG: CARDB domain-containing protein [Thermodesulfobacteriota bacterium]
MTTWLFAVNPTVPGRHRLEAVLTVGGLTSRRETGFSYGTGLCDLTVDLWGDLQEVGESPSASLILVARNMGRGSSGPSAVVLSQGEGTEPLGTWDVEALGPGEGLTISYSVSLSSTPGPRALTARIDPQDRVREYDEGNNESYLLLTVPELSFVTATDKDSYGLGERVLITARIRNHGPSPLQGLLLETVIKDPGGVEVFSRIQGFALAGSSQFVLETEWVTQVGYALGSYVIEQRVVERAVSSRCLVVLRSGQDFSIEVDFSSREVEIGGEVEFGLRVVGAGGFSGEVALSLVGGPSDCTVYFVPNPVLVSGGGAVATLRVMTTMRTAAGSYGMRVVGKSGEVVRGVDVVLEVVGFEVRVTPGVHEVRQLEGAVFEVSVLCLGGYEGEVLLGVEGVPRGMRRL